MEVLRNPPSHSDFKLLSDHQSQTPASFYDGPAILYHQHSPCTLRLTSRDLEIAPAFKELLNTTTSRANGQVNGHAEQSSDVIADGDSNSQEVEIPSVDVWVTSTRFILFCPPTQTGISISYPSISLHAIQRPSTPSASTPAALYLQLLPEANATFDDHDPDETVSLYILPIGTQDTVASSDEIEGLAGERSSEHSDEVSKIFNALSACANLHPDPAMSGDEDMEQEDGTRIPGGQNPSITLAGHPESEINGVHVLSGEAGDRSVGELPPPMPGSGGWITADNVGDFVDENGNWRGRGVEGQERQLGEGAGRIREREEGGEDEGETDEGTKWTRTS